MKTINRNYVRLFEQFSRLEEELYVIDLHKEKSPDQRAGYDIPFKSPESTKTTFVFRNKDEHDAKLAELHAENPNLDRARLTQTIAFMEKKVPSYFYGETFEVSDIEDLYDSLSQQERREIDEMALSTAKHIGKTLFEYAAHSVLRILPKYKPIRYEVTRRNDTLGKMIEEFRKVLDSEKLDKAIERFGNRIDWIPDDILHFIRKSSKAKRLFGV